jgi:hypothetical protein
MSEEPVNEKIVDDEWLARFILYSRWIRSSDNTVKQDAFIPPQDSELSVTRHLDLSEAELWKTGQAVANTRSSTLYGRADLQAIATRNQSLEVRPDFPPKNHAIIIGWPDDKPAQKIIALELARAALYVSNPNPA